MRLLLLCRLCQVAFKIKNNFPLLSTRKKALNRVVYFQMPLYMLKIEESSNNSTKIFIEKIIVVED